MEIEYKWDMPDETAIASLRGEVRGFEPDERSIHMHAAYYDSADGLIARARGGLRIRREDGRSVCCLKLAAQSGEGFKARREYEVEASDIRSGLRTLPAVGAPEDICRNLLESDIVMECETEFDRGAFAFSANGFSAELAIDRGAMRRAGKEGPIHEVELEFKGGSLEAFHAFARKIEREHGLERQPLSKLARALAL